MPQIDVMMPAFNAAGTVRDAIGSLQNQTYRDLNIIVVDDGSTDETPQILDALARKDPRLTIIRQDNRGIVAARNVAFAASSSRYVAQLDADDLSEPNRIAKQATYLDANPDCVSLSGGSRHIDAQGRETGEVVRLPTPKHADAFWVPAREPLLLPFAMWRRSAVDKVGAYRNVCLGEDVDLAWRLLAQGAVVNLDDIVGSYRRHDSVTGTSLVNARMMVISTQLIAISAQRRERGVVDLCFEHDMSDRYRSAGSLISMYSIARKGLTEEEAEFCRIASAAKMLQWLEYRGKVPDTSDLTYIRSAYPLARRLPEANKSELKRLYSVIAARLIRSRKWHGAATLLPRQFGIMAMARALSGRC